MVRIPVIILENGRKVGSLEVDKSELLPLKQEALDSCKETLDWSKKDPEIKHVVYYEESVGLRGAIQSITIYKNGCDFTDEMFQELINKPYTGYVGAFHKRVAEAIEHQHEDLDSLACNLCNKIVDAFDSPAFECTLETAKDPMSNFYRFLKSLDYKYRNDIVIERALECVKRKIQEEKESFMESIMRNPFDKKPYNSRKEFIEQKKKMNESWVRAIKKAPLCYVIKNAEGKYYSYDEDSGFFDFIDDIEMAEAFDSEIDAEDEIQEIVTRLFVENGDINWDLIPDEEIEAYDNEFRSKVEEYKVVPIYGDHLHESNTKIDEESAEDVDDFLMDCIGELRQK